jgi:hypothetical protein
VVVVPKQAQLRDPNARFDPRQRDSRNVAAGLAGAGILGPYFIGDAYSNR